MEEKRNWKEKLMDYKNWKLRTKIIMYSLLIGSIIFMVFNFKIDIIWWIPLDDYSMKISSSGLINILLILDISAIIILILILFVKQFNKEEDISNV